MVVVAIIAGVIGLLLPRIDNRNNKIKATVRRFTVLARELHTRAKLKGATYRLAIDLGESPESPEQQKYWVEKSTQSVVLSEKDEKELRDELRNRASQKGEPKPKDPYGFDLDPTIIKEPQELPKPVRFLMVEKKGYKEPFTQGIAYIYFFPQGLSETAIIQIKSGESLQWTLAIEPLTGRADLVTQLLRIKDLTSK